MRKLYLVRHAHTEEANLGSKDFDRNLTEKGHKHCHLMADAIMQHDNPDIVLCSPSNRTMQTAEDLLFNMDLEVDIKTVPSLYNSDLDSYFEEVSMLDDDCKVALVVGHNPVIHEFAVALSARGDSEELENLAQKFTPGSVAIIDLDIRSWEEINYDRGRLEALFDPHEEE